ncbi:MAG: hypothetical protein LBI03_04725 [Clostridiales bacterium]|jgi:hypothetical protein|nr:hypothetical protein [Clostridiales bacterium]
MGDNSKVKKTGIVIIRICAVIAGILAIFISVNRYLAWKGSIRTFSVGSSLTENIVLGVSSIPETPFAPTVTFNNGNTISLSPSQIIWTSYNSSAAYVDNNGILIITGSGQTTITASYKNVSQSFSLNILKPLKNIYLSLDREPILYPDTTDGNSIIPSALLIYMDGSCATIENSLLNWSSSNPKIADFDTATGTIRGFSAGVATLTFSYNGMISHVKITCSNLDITDIFFTDTYGSELSSATLNTNVYTPANPFKLNAYGVFKNGEIFNIKNDKLIWNSENEKIVQAGAGILVPFFIGNTNISVKFGDISTSLPVYVRNSTPDDLIFPSNTINATLGPRNKVVIISEGELIQNGQLMPLKAIFPDIGSISVASMAYWESSDTDVADVTNGVLKINGTGKATITIMYCGLRKSVYLNVNPFIDNSMMKEY